MGGVQEQMLTHQKDAQLNMLEAEKSRALDIMKTQYEQQFTQQKLSIEQAYKQQHSQLEMAKTQRDMAIQQQAAHMMTQASHYQMHVDMQTSMAKAYGTAFNPGAGFKGASEKKPESKGTTP